jgi:hypothetical protein
MSSAIWRIGLLRGDHTDKSSQFWLYKSPSSRVKDQILLVKNIFIHSEFTSEFETKTICIYYIYVCKIYICNGNWYPIVAELWCFYTGYFSRKENSCHSTNTIIFFFLYILKGPTEQHWDSNGLSKDPAGVNDIHTCASFWINSAHSLSSWEIP